MKIQWQNMQPWMRKPLERLIASLGLVKEKHLECEVQRFDSYEREYKSRIEQLERVVEHYRTHYDGYMAGQTRWALEHARFDTVGPIVIKEKSKAEQALDLMEVMRHLPQELKR